MAKAGENFNFSNLNTLANDVINGFLDHTEATGDFTLILTEIATACKWISNIVRRAELAGVIGLSGGINVQHEKVQKLDVLSNQTMCHLLRRCGKVAFIVSEECEEPIFFENAKNAKYCVCFDPLDGSTNIDCGVSIGTIFGIYSIANPANPRVEDVLKDGSNLVAGGFCQYGSSTKMVLAFKDSKNVRCYNFDPLIGEFVMTHSNIIIGNQKIFSINEGHYKKFNPAIREYLDIVKNANSKPGEKGTEYSARYIGSMAGDLMRTVMYGGIFIYPTSKLRVLYECFPMALIVECVGGLASTGTSRMLDYVPKTIHDRSPIILGSKDEVEMIEKLYAKHNIK